MQARSSRLGFVNVASMAGYYPIFEGATYRYHQPSIKEDNRGAIALYRSNLTQDIIYLAVTLKVQDDVA